MVRDVFCRPRWGLLLAGSVLLLLAIPGVGTAMAAVTINHTVTTSKLAVQFGNATTNTPDDPERIDSLKWTGSSGVQTANLAASGGGSCGDGREWWGESFGAVVGQPPFLVAGGSTGTWSSPTANEVEIQSQSSSDPTCFTTRPQIPISTTYAGQRKAARTHAAAGDLLWRRTLTCEPTNPANTTDVATETTRIVAIRVANETHRVQ